MFEPKSLLRRTEVRYGLVGIANTLFGLLVIYFAKWCGLGDVVANLVGYSCGLLLSFRLNSRWTFSYEGATLPALMRFGPVILAAYAANLVVVLGGINVANLNSWYAQALGVIPFTLVSYLGQRWFAFASR